VTFRTGPPLTNRGIGVLIPTIMCGNAGTDRSRLYRYAGEILTEGSPDEIVNIRMYAGFTLARNSDFSANRQSVAFGAKSCVHSIIYRAIGRKTAHIFLIAL